MRRIGIAFACLAAAAAAAAPDSGKKGSALLLKDGFPPISAEDKSLASVPYAPEAAVVVLLEAEHHEVVRPPEATSDQDAELRANEQTPEEELRTERPRLNPRERVKYWRRVKLLRADAAGAVTRWTREFGGPFRIEEVSARVVTADGRVVDASGGIVRVPASGAAARGSRCRVEVTFPEAGPGAILDLYLSGFRDDLPSLVWAPRDVFPVLDSRLALEGPTGLVFGTLGVGLSEAEKTPESFRVIRGSAHVWRWTDQPAAGVEPLSPKGRGASASLIVAMRALRDGNFRFAWAADWKEWGQRERKEGWDDWMVRKSHACEEAAVAAAGGLAGPLEKAAAVGAVLRSRIRTVEPMYARTADSADDVLVSGAGTTAEVAAVAVVMLRKLGVPSDLVVYRDRRSGPLPMQGPLPVLLDGAAVRLAGTEGPVWFDPMSTAPLGTIPPALRGLHVFAMDGVAEAPVPLPALAASDRRLTRFVRGKLDAEGSLAAEGTFTYHGAAADELRARLRVADDAARRELFAEGLTARRGIADVALDGVEGLDDAKELVVKGRWRVDAFATKEDGGLRFDPRLFGAYSESDWTSETRREDIDFGDPFDLQDVVSITLPAGWTVASPPPPFSANAPPVGAYSTSVSAGGSMVSMRRQLRIDTPRVPATAWNGLKPWLRDIARADATTLLAKPK